MSSRMMRTLALVSLAVFVWLSTTASAQSVSVTNIGHSSAEIDWDIAVDGAIIVGFEISVDCNECTPFNVSGNGTGATLTGLKDNTPFQVCVAPYTTEGIGTQECAQFRTLISPRTAWALAVGILLILSFFLLLAIDLLCRRHQIEVEDAKRDELLEQGWQTFKRRSTERVAKGKEQARRGGRSPSTARRADDDFENIGDVTFEEELLD
ncbi:uncharacterized protein [Diadema setosum]|uniref:uncharacterized protein n=1 Tax=Diadema setosum TaxID=31175 RepID=UPI003B3A0953